MRHNDGDRLIGLPAGKNFLDVIQQWFQKETVGRIHNDETGAASPCFPFFADLFRIIGFHGDVDGSDIIR